MRHRKTGRRLGRTSSHRAAMRRNMINSLFLVERIRTTPAKAKEVRGMAEKMVTLAKKGGLANLRMAIAALDDKFIVRKLFKEIGPRFQDRPGGYTRIIRLSATENRLGDNAPQVLLELLPAKPAEVEQAVTAESGSEKR